MANEKENQFDSTVSERRSIAQEFAKRLNGLSVKEAKLILGEAAYLIEVSTKSDILVTYP